MGGMFIRRRKELTDAPHVVDTSIQPIDLSPVARAVGKMGEGLGDLGKGIGDIGNVLVVAKERQDEEEVDDAVIKFRVKDSQVRNGGYKPMENVDENGVTENGEQLPMFEKYDLHERRRPERIPGICDRRGLSADGGTREWQDAMRTYADELTKDFSKKQKEAFWRKSALFYQGSLANMTQWEIRERQHGSAKKLEKDMEAMQSASLSDLTSSIEGLKDDQDIRKERVGRMIEKHVQAGKTLEEAQNLARDRMKINDDALQAGRYMCLDELLTSMAETEATYVNRAMNELGMSREEALDGALVQSKSTAMKAIAYVAEVDPDSAEWMIWGYGERDESDTSNRNALGLTEMDVQKAKEVIDASRKRKKSEAYAKEQDRKREVADAQEKQYNKMYWSVMRASGNEELNAINDLLDSDAIGTQFKENPQAVHSLKQFIKGTKEGWEREYDLKQRKAAALQTAMTKAEEDARKQRRREMEDGLLRRVLDLKKMMYEKKPTKDQNRARLELLSLFNVAQEENLLPAKFLMSVLSEMKTIDTEDEAAAKDMFDNAFGAGVGNTDAGLRKALDDGEIHLGISRADGKGYGEPTTGEYLELRDQFVQSLSRLPAGVNKQEYASKVLTKIRTDLVKRDFDDIIRDAATSFLGMNIDAQKDVSIGSHKFIMGLAGALSGKKDEKKTDKDKQETKKQ